MKNLIERTKLFGKQIELKGEMSNTDMMAHLGLLIEAMELDPSMRNVEVCGLVRQFCGAPRGKIR